MVIAWIGYCLLISGLLALAAFASERALGHFRKPVRWAWFAAIAGSVTVPLVAFFAPGFLPGIEASSGATAGVSSDLVFRAAAPAAPMVNAPAGGGFDAAAVGAVLVSGWVLLVVTMVGYLGRAYGRLRSEMRTWTPGRIAGSPVMISDERGPAVVGIRRSVVVMPKWIPELEDRLLRLVFLHEREHQRAGDHRLFAAAIATIALMPWNLFLWWQVSRLRLAIEFDCDRRVLEKGESPRDYADALITVGSRVSGPLLAAAAFAERKPAVEKRLRRMTDPRSPMPLIRTLGASGVAMLAVLLALGCPGPESALNAPEPPAATVTPPSEASEWVPPLLPGEDAMTRGDRPSFIAYDRPPVLQNAQAVMGALEAAYPQDLKEAGIGGRVEMWLYLDTSGAVRNTELKTSSGHDALDRAAADVVSTMSFQPAANRDQPTDVWVSQWVTFEIADSAAESPAGGAGPATEGSSALGSPLIIVDGVIQSEGASLEDLQALDIDHVEIVKGERALELYGERARDGVVEITTKGGAAADNGEGSGGDNFTVVEVAPSDAATGPDDGLEIDYIATAGVLTHPNRDGTVTVIVPPGDMPDPLIVVDGVIQADGAALSDVGSLDIDHVEIVRGESALELYGERARHGVIEITTKAGATDGDGSKE